ncbi:MAG: stage 0 sporulation family protein [Desulfovibrionaceae bacterium]
MSQKLGIKFADYGQIYHFSSGPFVVEKGQLVIVKTDQGMGLGEVVAVELSEEESEHSAIYRLANDQDLDVRAENLDLAREAYRHCRRCIADHGLEMKLVDVEVFFDRSKMVFYFTAPGRIDFRELIKDLVREFRTRIELRQIGVRHETQMLGAIGNCGQMCCCRRFMRKFVPVTIKMAKEQNLFLNPTKISGICGRLLCCLSFEQEGYEEFNRKCPKIGKRFTTSEGMVKVIRANFFRKSLTAIFEDGSDREIPIDEWAEFVSKPPARGEEGGRPAREAAPREKAATREKAAPREREDRQDGAQRPPREPRREPSRLDRRGAAPEDAPEGQGEGDDPSPKRPRRRRRRPRKKSRD